MPSTPSWLAALDPEHVELEAFAAGAADVWVAYLSFEAWPGPPLGMSEDCNKRGGRVTGSTGELSCAEVEITKRLRADHWDGGWFNSFGTCGRRRWGEFMVGRADLPGTADRLIEAVSARIGRSGGVPDVIAWRRRQVVYVESKGPHDKIDKQREWLGAALDLGLDRDAFAVVKWRPS